MSKRPSSRCSFASASARGSPTRRSSRTSSSVEPSGTSSAAAKTYDDEIWFPSQDRYRETASISNTTDFQSRRLGIRYRDGKSPEPVHMLNGTAVVDRMALAILENFQGEVPDVLREYGAPATVRP